MLRPVMTIEKLLLSIEGLLALGFGAWLLVTVARPKLGCLILLAVPVAMIAYVSWWHGQHPENLRSTSALDYLFGPLWLSLGALTGYCAASCPAPFATRHLHDTPSETTSVRFFSNHCEPVRPGPLSLACLLG